MRLKRTTPGILLILLANAIALIGVELNRGEPLQRIQITERELSLVRTQDQDNSGIDLKLIWNAGPSFDRQKMQALGFGCPPTLREKIRIPLPKVVFAALEYEGRAWTEWMSKQAEQFPRAGTLNLNLATRLSVVDVAKTAAELQAKYPDSTHYVIVRALARAIPGIKEKTRVSEWHGRVVAILPDEIHVPLPYAPALAHLNLSPPTAPRYSVTLCYGRRFEPWISSVTINGPSQ